MTEQDTGGTAQNGKRVEHGRSDCAAGRLEERARSVARRKRPQNADQLYDTRTLANGGRTLVIEGKVELLSAADMTQTRPVESAIKPSE